MSTQITETDKVLTPENFPSAKKHNPAAPGVSDTANTGDIYLDFVLGKGNEMDPGKWYLHRRKRDGE